jgi:cysteinyl-tRNA synthetase
VLGRLFQRAVKVRYWEAGWRAVLLGGDPAIGAGYLDRIVDQGFDGIYLDIVDAFEFFGPKQAGGENVKRDAAAAMVRLVLDLAHHARVVRGKPGFLIVPQNGSNAIDPEWYPPDTLGEDDAATPELTAALWRDRLFATVDAIGVEDTFFYGKKDENNPLKPQGYLLGVLAEWRQAGIPVLATEYVTKTKKIAKLHDQLAPVHDFVPLATRRDLDRLVIHPGFEPD